MRANARTSFGKPAVPATGIEEFVADARVRSDPLPNHIDVGSDLVAEIRDVVHEGDSRRQHRIGCIFGHLGRRNIHEIDSEIVDQKGSVQSRQEPLRTLRLRTDDDPVGRHEILDRRSLFQEFGVRRHLEGDLHAPPIQLLLNDGLHLLRRSYGNGRLGDQNRVFIDVAPERAGHFQHITQVSRSVFVGRRTDGREDDLHLIQTTAQIRGEMQASRFDVAPNQIVEPRFVDRNLARQQTPDLLLVDIDAGHIDAHFGKAGARHQSDVACSHN